MRFLTSTVFLALLAASVAHPTNDQLVLEVDSDRNVSKKACTIKQPDILQYLYQGLPDYTFPNLAGKGGYFRADSRFAPNGKRVNQVYQVVAFTNIPSDARGPCELRFHIPPGYPVYYYPDSPGWAPLYSVYTLFYDDPSSISPNNRWSWNLLTTNNGMKKSGLWGSPQARATEYPQYVNSAACKKNLAYLFTLADEVSSNSSVQFVQSANPQAGAYLTYNC